MEGLSTKSLQSGTAVSSKTRGVYEIGKIGACKTWHGRPHISAKRGVNKGRIYTSTYAPGADRNTTAEI